MCAEGGVCEPFMEVCYLRKRRRKLMSFVQIGSDWKRRHPRENTKGSDDLRTF